MTADGIASGPVRTRIALCASLSLSALIACAPVHAQIAAPAPAPAVAQAAPSVPVVPTIAGIGPVGEWRKLGEGYLLSEGPAPTRDGGLFFTDYRGGVIYRIDAAGGQPQKWLEGVNAGGVAIAPDGALIVAEGRSGRIIRIDRSTKAVTPIAATIDGVRFNAPNDLALDGRGGLYFTDPANGATLPLAQGKQSVYHVAADGKVTRVVDYLPRPNGVLLSNDGKTLYIGLTLESEVLAYRIGKGGALASESSVFGRVAYTPPVKRGDGAYTGVDGMAIDAAGNIYTASKFGIEVFDPAGKSLGTIATPARPSNLKFGGADGRTLFVTTYDAIYAVPMAARAPGALPR
jgi:gluconolactonase